MRAEAFNLKRSQNEHPHSLLRHRFRNLTFNHLRTRSSTHKAFVGDARALQRYRRFEYRESYVEGRA